MFFKFQYSDKLDKILMIIGSVCGLLSAALYPLIFYLFGEVAGSFVEFEAINILKDRIRANGSNITEQQETNLINFILKNQSTCGETLLSTSDFDKKINESIIFYVIFGFSSVFCNYLAFVTFNTAAERQVKRVR